MRIAAVDNILPSVERVGFCVVRLNNKYSQNCKAKNNSRNESTLIKRSVCVRGFILAVEGLSAAGDRAGKAVLITFLKNNCNNDECSGNEKQYKKYDFKNFHFLLPFKIISR